MTEFLGKNGLSVGELFLQRTKYSTQAFARQSGNLYIKPVNDFMFAERLLYGRINNNHEVIAANESFLKELKFKNSSKMPLQVLNFVADAFEDMVREMQSQALAGKLDSSDPYLFELKAYKSFSSSKIMYLNYINSLKEVFINSYVREGIEEQIKDFTSFMTVFFQFLEDAAQSLPINKSSFIASNICSPMVSGLSIDLTDLDPSDDQQKQLILDSPNFPYFVQVAKKYGFYIDKFIPWRITADISNEIMLGYASRYNARSESRVLSTYYQIVGGNSVTDLQKMAFDFYNDLVNRRPTVRTYDGPNVTVTCRKRVTIETVVGNYSEKFWVDRYIDLLYIERRKPMSAGAVLQLKKDCEQFLSKFNLTYVLSLVNINIVGFDKFQGSYANIRTKRLNVKDNTNFKPTY